MKKNFHNPLKNADSKVMQNELEGEKTTMRFTVKKPRCWLSYVKFGNDAIHQIF